MKALNLRHRIAAVIAATCISVVLALGAVLYVASEKLEAALLDQLLNEELNFFVQHWQNNASYARTPGPNIQYYAVRTPEDEAFVPEYARTLAPGQYEINIGQGRGDRDIVVRQVGDMRFIVIYDIGPYEDREREFHQLLGISVLTVAGLALILGYFAAGVLTRQLTQLAQRVSGLAPGSPPTQLKQEGQDLEVATLAQALDEYRLRMLDMVQREQEFTANTSHELRTPLTAIRTSCDLLLQEPALPAGARARILFISQAVAHMTEHIEALLFLARGEALADEEVVALNECVNDAAVLLQDEMTDKGLDFEVAVAPAAVLKANREALRIVITNLLQNAVSYTEQGHIRVEGDATRLVISDSGMGMAQDQLTRIFERHYRAESKSSGQGIGLHIVERICSRFGWTIEVSSTPSVGSSFVITFASA